MYDDRYPTCSKTYATLCIYPDRLDPTEVTTRLGIEPSSWQRRGDIPHDQLGRRHPRSAKLHGWFLSSKGKVTSRDPRRHLDWILDQIIPKAAVLAELQAAGCRMDISCYWSSIEGHGGPTLSPDQMRNLGELNLELWFDFYGGR